MFVVSSVTFVRFYVFWFFAFVFACCVVLSGSSIFKILHPFLCFFHLPRYIS